MPRDKISIEYPIDQYPFQIKGWDKFQHYRYRNPPWIRLYRTLLDDLDWHALDPLASKVLAMCWLLAAESSGYLPTTAKIAFRLHMSEASICSILIKLDQWVIQRASGVLASRKQVATPDTDTDTDTDKKDISPKSAPSDPAPSRVKTARAVIPYSEEFEVFWRSYPDTRNNSKRAAYAEWQALGEVDRGAATASIPGFAAYCRKIPDYRVVHCERYLRQRRFDSFGGGATTPGREVRV